MLSAPLTPPAASCTRRQALGRLASLLALGLWPGVRSVRAGETEPFTFLVANDFHHRDAGCDAWFAALFRQMTAPRDAAFCLAVGDLADQGAPESLASLRHAASAAGLTFHPVPGNHDNDVEKNTRLYSTVYPERLNYAFAHGGWQFVGLDSTEGEKYKDTTISNETLQWLDRELPKLDPRRPTVVFTHFPLAQEVTMCPLNAEAVLERLLPFNLRAVFSGHFHGQTRHQRRESELVTNACCARVRSNHDGTNTKGYWKVRAEPDGSLHRDFVDFAPEIENNRDQSVLKF